MKKTIIIFFVFGIGISYLYLLWRHRPVNVVQPPRENGKPFSFSFDEAPKNTLRGTVRSLSGDVYWISRTATEQAVLTKDIALQQGEDLVTGEGGIVQLDFSEGTSVTVGENSYLSLIQTLPGNITFKQNSGTAEYFSGDAPVSVTAFHLLAMSEGKMTISLDTESGGVTVRADEGAVRLGFNDINYNSITVQLQEGDTYQFDDTTRTGEID